MMPSSSVVRVFFIANVAAIACRIYRRTSPPGMICFHEYLIHIYISPATMRVRMPGYVPSCRGVVTLRIYVRKYCALLFSCRLAFHMCLLAKTHTFAHVFVVVVADKIIFRLLQS